jgi:hypothetical protein
LAIILTKSVLSITKLIIMKNIFFKKSLLAGTLILALATTFTSCKKDDVDDSGSANLKIVNASSTSSAQSFYLAGNTVVQGGLTFGNVSDYLVTNSGNNLALEFRNEGSASVYASNRFDIDKGAYYSVFLAGDGQSARVKLYKDDLTAPSSGKAKVRFIHLSDAAPANVDIRRGATTNIVVNLGRDNASNYIEVDPGVLSLQVFATGQSTSLGTFDLSAFAAGKIYTVYVTGSTTSSISVRQISHN